MNLLRNKPAVITIVIAVLLIIMIALTGPGSAANATVVGDAFMPLQNFFYGISDKINGLMGTGADGDGEADPALQAQLDAYKLQLSAYEELEAENERLSAMLEYKQNNPAQDLVVAGITGKDPGNWFDVFTIDRGRNHGVMHDMAVITPDGLVGIIEEAGMGWSKVMAITDSRSGVAALVERTRDIGVVKGSLDPNALDPVLSMDYLPLDTDIVVGDRIVTSGLDGLYPKGILIGEVTEVTDEAGGKSVSVQPAVDFRRLEEVMVVREVTEDEGSTSEDISGNRVIPEGALPTPSPEGDTTDTGDDTSGGTQSTGGGTQSTGGGGTQSTGGDTQSTGGGDAQPEDTAETGQPEESAGGDTAPEEGTPEDGGDGGTEPEGTQ